MATATVGAHMAARARVRTSRLTMREIAFHRNGISSAGFYVVAFVFQLGGEATTRNMVAIVFREPGNVAVFDRDRLGLGYVAYGGIDDDGQNSWRADSFEADLRAAILLERGEAW